MTPLAPHMRTNGGTANAPSNPVNEITVRTKSRVPSTRHPAPGTKHQAPRHDVKDVDMYGRLPFPPKPTSANEIFDPSVQPWLIACSLVGNYSLWQVNTYRKYWALMDDLEFREQLDVVRVLLGETKRIKKPAAYLTAQLAARLFSGGTIGG